MKTILVPTDFSATANNAARYAIKLAAQLNAQIILLNIYMVRVAAYDIPMAVVPEEDIKDICIPQLRKLTDKLNKHNPTEVKIKIAAIKGSPGHTIVEFADSHHVDMIVMGTHGESAAITRLFGNTTSHVLRESKIPVLAVPGHARFKDISNVLVTCDRSDSFTDPVIDALKNISEKFNARLNMVKVFRLSEAMIYGTGVPGIHKVNEKLGSTPHEFNYQIMAEAVDGIVKASKKYKADLIVIISHKHDLATRIFKGSTTKQIIESSKKPILIIPEKISKKEKIKIFDKEEMPS